MNETVKLNDEELDLIAGGKNEGRYDYVPDNCGDYVNQYNIQVGKIYYRNDVVGVCCHGENHWSKVFVENVWEEPHHFLFIKWTKRMVTYVNIDTGERFTQIADKCLHEIL